MKRFDITMFLEGLFLGIACLFAYLVFVDWGTKEQWSRKELFLFGCGLGMAMMGAAVEVWAG